MKYKEEYHEVREVYLKQLVYNLIINYGKVMNIKPTPRKNIEIPQKQNTFLAPTHQPRQIQTMPIASALIVPAPGMSRIRQMPQIRNIPRPARAQMQQRPMQKAPQQMASEINKSQAIGSVMTPVKSSSGGTITVGEGELMIHGMEKIMPFLLDLSVQSLECPGPEKPILVSKNGLIQTTNLLMTKEEIDMVLNEISDRTRIPIVPGVFKAAFDKYIITAIVSEFVGSRFTIQRKPMMQYPIIM